MADKKPRFRVVIVGGSIAGLSLAHCLLRQQVDFVVLESHQDIAPQVGASIGILPNGARILDQLGCFDDILAATEPLQEASFWNADGKLIAQSNLPKILEDRHGYPSVFVDRQVVLEVLFRQLGKWQDHILTGKRVVKVDHLPDGVRVHCADGSVFEGDLVVGADGVRSVVRQQMWNYMDSKGLVKEASEERAAMVSEYSCVFGISAATPGLVPGTSHRTFGRDWSFLTIIGRAGRVYWFFFKKFDRKYSATEIPRLDQTMVDQYVAPYLKKPISSTVPFEKVYTRAMSKTLLALEEACFKHWAIDRWVCIGDSAHKMTPNLGQGGNSAIESAAALANCLARLLQSSSDPTVSYTELDNYLQSWQEKRRPRAQRICKDAQGLTQLEALKTIKDRVVGLYLLPYLDEHLANTTSKTIVGAEKIEYLPAPARSLTCKMQFTDSLPAQKVTLWERALWTAPLLGIFVVSKASLAPLISAFGRHLQSTLEKGTWGAANGEVLDLTRPFYHIGFLDKLMRPLVTCFLPSVTGSDPQSHLQMLSFMTDLGPIYGIWLLESYRNAHSLFEVLLPLAAGTIFQLLGIYQVAPLFLAQEYLRNPLSKLLVGDNRKISGSLVGSLTIATIAGYHTITYANFLASTLKSRQWYNALWQVFPLTTPLLQGAIYLTARALSTARQYHQTSTPQKDTPRQRKQRHCTPTRYVSRTLALISGLTFLYARFRAAYLPVSFPALFLPSAQDALAPVPSLSDGIARFLKFDELIASASGFVWLALRFRELEAAGARVPWVKGCCGFAASLVTLGPGATFALGWGWREEVMEQLARERGSSR
ncbi:FAD-dependent oxidoreductase [Aspergillus mulundensis]|uniref:FAD-binding domain-containing protein n=1 Tax=Aspergillus mulundensis TaxID=1810919 RepID=A0A3D8REK0_9EURO|nr:Uncharacterized protein DSM5745_07538 [Aspergillus mulundensis]RDW72366.1 Uncharacterized protein DSM5745_07538 [Aspergillus mulundensis]